MSLYPEYNIIERYPAENTIGFTGVNLEWGIFSNFANTPLVVNGKKFTCVEHIYHYIRINNEKDREEYLNRRRDLTLKGVTKGWKKRGIERSDWREIAVDVMRFCLNYKYEQSEVFRNELERSKGYYIIENESNRKGKNIPDSWGAAYDTETNEYYGKNIMGRILMELREKGKLESNYEIDF